MATLSRISGTRRRRRGLEEGPTGGHAPSTGRAHLEVVQVLLALDGSPVSRAAVRTVASRPWPPGSRVRVVYVAQVGSAASELATMAVADLVAAEKEAGELIERATREIARPELPVDGVVLRGEPQLEILDEAGRWGADLIVLGTHGRRGVQRLLEGSVAEHVMRHASCSVEVARLSPEEDGT